MRIFALLRHTLPARAVPVGHVRATVRYQPTAQVESGLRSMSEAGLIDLGPDSLTLSPRGRDAMADLNAVSEAVVADLWRRQNADTPRLTDLADRALRAALAAPGPALSVVAPPYDSPTSTPATRLAERLTGLRFHRADSHAAAWMAAGLSVHDVQQLTPGPQKDAIEADTNQRAALAYAPLAPGERREFVAGLTALPG
jgi:hypothetical protein